jgi:hypothetical protein
MMVVKYLTSSDKASSRAYFPAFNFTFKKVTVTYRYTFMVEIDFIFKMVAIASRYTFMVKTSCSSKESLNF